MKKDENEVDDDKVYYKILATFVLALVIVLTGALLSLRDAPFTDSGDLPKKRRVEIVNKTDEKPSKVADDNSWKFPEIWTKSDEISSDLKAQEIMAQSAVYMSDLARYQLIASIVGTFFLIFTLFETRRVSKGTLQSLQQQRELERARLEIKILELDVSKGKTKTDQTGRQRVILSIQILCQFENIGYSAAIVNNLELNVQIISAGTSISRKFIDTDCEKEKIKHDCISNFQISERIEITLEDFAKINYSSSIEVIAVIKYTDVFGYAEKEIFFLSSAQTKIIGSKTLVNRIAKSDLRHTSLAGLKMMDVFR